MEENLGSWSDGSTSDCGKISRISPRFLSIRVNVLILDFWGKLLVIESVSLAILNNKNSVFL
jgi:hypothetical protein